MRSAQVIQTAGLGAIITGSLFLAGCSSTTHDTSGTEVEGGIATARQGVQLVRNDAVTSSGTADAGNSEADRGIGMMTDGTGRVENGMNMMTSDMMHGCCRGSDEVVIPMKNAIAQVKDGRDKLTDGDPLNDADGTTEIQDGCNAMNDALDQAERVMTCMGHGSMTSMM